MAFMSHLNMHLLPIFVDALGDAGCDDDSLLDMAAQCDPRILFLLYGAM